jgi:hypothetical protein
MHLYIKVTSHHPPPTDLLCLFRHQQRVAIHHVLLTCFITPSTFTPGVHRAAISSMANQRATTRVTLGTTELLAYNR